jgi:hypothetical protein
MARRRGRTEWDWHAPRTSANLGHVGRRAGLCALGNPIGIQRGRGGIHVQPDPDASGASWEPCGTRRGSIGAAMGSLGKPTGVHWGPAGIWAEPAGMHPGRTGIRLELDRDPSGTGRDPRGTRQASILGGQGSTRYPTGIHRGPTRPQWIPTRLRCNSTGFPRWPGGIEVGNAGFQKSTRPTKKFREIGPPRTLESMKATQRRATCPGTGASG